MEDDKKTLLVKEATAATWMGQAVENFYNPRSRWLDSSTLIDRIDRRGNRIEEIVDSFSWNRSPQGVVYWSLIIRELR